MFMYSLLLSGCHLVLRSSSFLLKGMWGGVETGVRRPGAVLDLLEIGGDVTTPAIHCVLVVSFHNFQDSDSEGTSTKSSEDPHSPSEGLGCLPSAPSCHPSWGHVFCLGHGWRPQHRHFPAWSLLGVGLTWPFWLLC